MCSLDVYEVKDEVLGFPSASERLNLQTLACRRLKTYLTKYGKKAGAFGHHLTCPSSTNVLS